MCIYGHYIGICEMLLLFCCQGRMTLSTLQSYLPKSTLASLVAQMVKNLITVWEAWVQSLACEDPLEAEMVTPSSILARRIPLDRGAWQATVHRVAKSWTCLSN